MMSMKAHRGTAVVPGTSNGYLTTHGSIENKRWAVKETLLSHVNAVAIVAPLAPCLRRNVLASRTRGIQATRRDVALIQRKEGKE